MLRKAIIITISSLAIGYSSGDVANRSRAPLGPLQAVALAEQFIAANGYTTDAPDKSSISYESIERGSSDEEILARRRNTLRPSAYGYSRSDSGWLVIFRYTKDHERNRSTGRAVTMNNYGKSIRVAHQDIYLNSSEVVLESK